MQMIVYNNTGSTLDTINLTTGSQPTPTATPANDTLVARGSSWKSLYNGSNQGTAWYGTSLFALRHDKIINSPF